MEHHHTSWVLFGTQLSPFALKIALGLADRGIPFKWHWQFGVAGRAKFELKRLAVVNGLAKLHIPKKMSALEEFPLVPFLFGDDGTNAFDSTAILKELHVDEHLPTKMHRFLSMLLEEFFDEWGLYLVHHKRWTDPTNREHWGGALNKTPGGYLFLEEMYGGLPSPRFVSERLAKWFNNRQTVRRKYLFSMGEEDVRRLGEAGKPTRQLLDESFDRILEACELMFSNANFSSVIPGSTKLTAADYALFGQLNMLAHLDRGTRQTMEHVAPRLLRWLDQCQFKIQQHTGQETFESAATPKQKPSEGATIQNEPHHEEGLAKLLEEVFAFHLRKLSANKEAYKLYQSMNQKTEFNEIGFNNKRGLYSSVLGDGTEFTSVVKTFQVKVFDETVLAWESLSSTEKVGLSDLTNTPNFQQRFEKALFSPPPMTLIHHSSKKSKL